MNLSYYVFPDDSEKAAKDFAGTSKILSFFAQKFCEYPFITEKFGYAEAEGELTMENQTVCTIEPRFITGKKDYESTIVHETAHQWWGDLVTPTHWGDIWLSEGFATYAEALYRESAYSPDSYRRYVAWLMGDGQGRLAGPVVNYQDTAFWSLFSSRVYIKGAVVLHMLRGVAGDSTFFTLMRNFLNDERFRYGNATTADFIQTAEREYGGSLNWFFDEWLFASTDSLDRPEYTYSWSSKPTESGFRVQLDLTQISAPRQLFRMPMNVSVSMGESEQRFRIDDSLATQSFTFEVRDQPTSVEIDKENYVMKIIRRKEDN
jgi:aminopeptidase N